MSNIKAWPNKYLCAWMDKTFPQADKAGWVLNGLLIFMPIDLEYIVNLTFYLTFCHWNSNGSNGKCPKSNFMLCLLSCCWGAHLIWVSPLVCLGPYELQKWSPRPRPSQALTDHPYPPLPQSAQPLGLDEGYIREQHQQCAHPTLVGSGAEHEGKGNGKMWMSINCIY